VQRGRCVSAGSRPRSALRPASISCRDFGEILAAIGAQILVDLDDLELGLGNSIARLRD
jgi:hypothetical protein